MKRIIVQEEKSQERKGNKRKRNIQTIDRERDRRRKETKERGTA